MVSYLIDPSAPSGASGAVEMPTARFSIYLSPLKLRWVCWSRLDKTTLNDQGQAMVDAPGAIMGLIDGHMELRVISPWGQVSPINNYDANDANGVPVGQQAVVYGDKNLTPDIVRNDRQGKRYDLTEGGLLDDFVQRNGEGYYVFELTYRGASSPLTHQPIYLLVDVVEGYRQRPPIILDRRPGNFVDGWESTANQSESEGYFGNTSSHSSSDDDSSNSSTTTDTTTDETTSSDTSSSTDNPSEPNEPNEPNVPEPATLALLGLGLGLAGAVAWQRRLKRAVEQARP